MNRPQNQTLGIATTLAWEFWARSWRHILVAPLGALAFPGLVFIIFLAAGGPVAWRTTQSILMQYAVYWPTLLLLGSIIVLNPGKPGVHYTLPAPSWLLVAVPMACAMTAMLVDYAIAAAVLNFTFDVDWKILGPGLLAAVLFAWCHVLLWSTSNSVALRSLATLASVVAFSFTLAEWGPSSRLTMDRFLPSVGRWHLLSFALATVACVGVGTAGFARLRHGFLFDFRPILDWISARLRFMPVTRKAPFASPRAAQFWLEWVERGWVLPAVITVLGIGAIVLVSCLPAKEIQEPFETIGAFSALFVAAAFVTAFFWGSRSSTFEFRAFKGSQPLSDRQIAAAVLKSVTVGLISAASIWAAFMVVAFSIVAARHGNPPFGWTREIVGGRFLCTSALIALVVWSVVSFITSLALAGKKAIGAAFGLLIGMWLGAILLDASLHYAPRLRVRGVMEGYAWGCLELCLIGCAAAHVASWRLHLLSVPAIALAVAIVLTPITVLLLIGEPVDLVELLLFCLPPIPLAAAPLAVYVNRHR